MDPDPHIFSLLDLDPDPGGENLREKTEKMQGKLKKIVILLQIINLQNPWFLFFEQYFLSISTLHKVICYPVQIL